MISCPYCNIGIEVVNRINTSLPIGERIDLINIFSGDPRCEILSKIYNTNDFMEWAVPILIVDDYLIQQKFNSYMKINKERYIFTEVSTSDHYLTLLKKLLTPY